MLELVVTNLERSFFHTALLTRKKFGHEVVTPTIKFIYVLMTNIISISMSSYKSMKWLHHTVSHSITRSIKRSGFIITSLLSFNRNWQTAVRRKMSNKTSSADDFKAQEVTQRLKQGVESENVPTHRLESYYSNLVDQSCESAIEWAFRVLPHCPKIRLRSSSTYNHLHQNRDYFKTYQVVNTGLASNSYKL